MFPPIDSRSAAAYYLRMDQWSESALAARAKLVKSNPSMASMTLIGLMAMGRYREMWMDEPTRQVWDIYAESMRDPESKRSYVAQGLGGQSARYSVKAWYCAEAYLLDGPMQGQSVYAAVLLRFPRQMLNKLEQRRDPKIDIKWLPAGFDSGMKTQADLKKLTDEPPWRIHDDRLVAPVQKDCGYEQAGRLN